MEPRIEAREHFPNQTRRQFLQFAGGCAAALGLSGALWYLGGGPGVGAGASDVVRPPGAPPEPLLLAGCIRCQQCALVCPTGALVTRKLESGILQVRTPYLDFDRGPCLLAMNPDSPGYEPCRRCIDRCPTGVLAAPDRAPVRLGMAVVDAVQCLGWKRGSCKRCVDVCPFGAIDLVDGRGPRVNPDLCTGCGACQEACPLPSYTGRPGKAIAVIPVLGPEGGSGA